MKRPPPNRRAGRRILRPAIGLIAIISVLGLVHSGSGLAAAAPQGPWTLPASGLSVPGPDAYYPQLAIGADGTVIAVWERFDGSKYVIQAAIRPPGGNFGGAVDLSTPGNSASDSQIVIAPDGTATAVWQSSNGVQPKVQAATRPPGGSFGAPVDLSAFGQSSYGPQIGIAPDGTATAIWYQLVGSDYIVHAATRSPGSGFGVPVELSASGQEAYSPRIAVGPDGTATAVWRRFDGSNFIIQSATRPPGEDFGGAVDLSAPMQSAYQTRIALAPDGTATAIWSRFGFIQASTRLPGGSFGGPVDLSAPMHEAYSPQIAIGPDGTAITIWTRFNGSNTIIQAATRLTGESFGSAVDLSAPGQNAAEPQIAVGSDGTATAVWYRSDGTDDVIQSRTRPPGSSFGPTTDLSNPGQDGESPEIAIGPDGRATAVWSQSDGTDLSIQYASTQAPPPPPSPPLPPTPQPPTPPPTPTPPSVCPAKTLKTGKLIRNRKKGVARLKVKAGGEGRVILRGSRKVKKSVTKVGTNGRGKLRVKARGRSVRKLRQRGKARVRIKLIYRPGGDCPNGKKTRNIKLVRKR